MELHERIDHDFTYHPPNATQVAVYESFRATARGFAHHIATECGDSRETTLALTALEQAVMWANAAIARHGL